jgi:hypothetical protein
MIDLRKLLMARGNYRDGRALMIFGSQNPLNCRQKCITRSRLITDRIDNMFDAAGQQRAARKQNDWQIGPIGLNQFGDGLTIHYWHLVIHNHRVNPVRSYQL